MGCVVNATPQPLYPRERPGTHCMRLGGPQGRSGRVQKISLPPGFDPQNIQPMPSPYTDWPIPVQYTVWAKCKAFECSSTWHTYLPSSSLHNVQLTFLIRSSNCMDLMIGCSAQYLNKSALIGTNSTYSITQFFGIELWKRRHHGNNQVFKATAQFTLQIRYQVL